MRAEYIETSLLEEAVGEVEENCTGQDYTWHWTGQHGRFLLEEAVGEVEET